MRHGEYFGERSLVSKALCICFFFLSAMGGELIETGSEI
jgi:hypothetical protein